MCFFESRSWYRHVLNGWARRLIPSLPTKHYPVARPAGIYALEWRRIQGFNRITDHGRGPGTTNQVVLLTHDVSWWAGAKPGRRSSPVR